LFLWIKPHNQNIRSMKIQIIYPFWSSVRFESNSIIFERNNYNCFYIKINLLLIEKIYYIWLRHLSFTYFFLYFFKKLFVDVHTSIIPDYRLDIGSILYWTLRSFNDYCQYIRPVVYWDRFTNHPFGRRLLNSYQYNNWR
jgi:hypothetical protein